MKQAKELANAIKIIAGADEAVFIATVKAVDKNKNICDVEFNEMEIGDVRLQAIIKANTKGILFYPAVDSWVLVQRLGKQGAFFITMFSEVEEMLLKIDNSIFDVTSSGIKSKINNTEVNVTDSGISIKKSAETLKNIMDDLIDAINQLTVQTNVGPSSVPINIASFTAIKTRVGQLLT